MFVCPLCNQIKEMEYRCVECQTTLQDSGRVMDYFDDYSAYLEIDGMKLIDGFANDQKNHLCPHVFYCSNCAKEVVYMIKEMQL